MAAILSHTLASLSLPLLVFYGAAGGASLAAAMVILSRNPVLSAVWLVLNFFCSAVLFLLLAAPFLAVIQILVYAGAIMVFFLFVLMFLRLRTLSREESLHPLWAWCLALAVIVPLLCLLWQSLPAVEPLAAAGAGFGEARSLSRLLLYGYPLAFELVSVLLLLAIVGGVTLARRRPKEGGGC